MKYVRRPHAARNQMWEYTRASRGGDMEVWLHVFYGLLLIALLAAAVFIAGGRFDLP